MEELITALMGVTLAPLLGIVGFTFLVDLFKDFAQ